MTDITAAELVSMGACEEGYDTFVKANGESATYLEALESNGLEDFFWYLSRAELTERQESDLRVFARQQALINVDKIVDYCSEEEYNTILNWLQTGEDRESARSAARSAAESAAESAAWAAAESAAESAERSAVRSAARSIWAVARSAAESAARAAAAERLKQIVAKW